MAVDEFRSYTPAAKAGVLYIREQPDQVVLDAARDQKSVAYAQVLEFMGGSLWQGGRCNPWWVISQCAEEAYRRGLIDEREFDRIAEED